MVVRLHGVHILTDIFVILVNSWVYEDKSPFFFLFFFPGLNLEQSAQNTYPVIAPQTTLLTNAPFRLQNKIMAVIMKAISLYDQCLRGELMIFRRRLSHFFLLHMRLNCSLWCVFMSASNISQEKLNYTWMWGKWRSEGWMETYMHT